MKRFKLNSALFAGVIAIIFAFNVFYMIRLYRSIREDVKRDVMAAMATSDIDELWLRAERSQLERNARFLEEQSHGAPAQEPRHGEISAGKDATGTVTTTTRYPDGEVTEQKQLLPGNESFTNVFVESISRQFHAVMDPYVDFDPATMDSILTYRLRDRGIKADFVAVDVVNSQNEVILPNPSTPVRTSSYDVFTFCFNPDGDLFYRAYITPLTRHILDEMMGVIVTILLLTATFAAASIYLYRTVSRLRTIEEMKDDFVNNMTHELKTPIAIAYSANDALLNYDTANDPDKKEAYLNIALKQLRRLGELVENILAMSMERRRTMTLKIERINVSELAVEIAASQRMRREKDITIDVKSTPAAWVDADRSHLANVMNNLVDNAIKYSGDSVDITIECDDRHIAVSDNGTGIPARCLPMIFDKFYRVPHGDVLEVRGYGIGLYYVKNIIDKLGWTITVKSQPGKGSVFTINFGNDEKQDTPR